MSKLDDKIARLEQEITQQRARLSDLAQKKKQEDRKAETRRKILYGGAFLAHVAGLPTEKRTRTLSTLHKFISRKADREFLGLPPLPEPKPNSDSAHVDGGNTPDMFNLPKAKK